MSLADQSLSIADFRRLGAFEIYGEADVAAFSKGKDVTTDTAAETKMPEDTTFRLGDLFSSPTKFRRILWLARRPEVLPEQLMRKFAHQVARQCVDRLAEEGELSDIRLMAAMKAHQGHLNGERHLSPLRQAVVQATRDHMEHANQRAADGCRTVAAALDPNAYEAGVEAAHVFMELFPDTESERWLRTCLRELIDQFK